MIEARHTERRAVAEYRQKLALKRQMLEMRQLEIEISDEGIGVAEGIGGA